MLLPPLPDLAVYNDADQATQDAMKQCYELSKGVDFAGRQNRSCDGPDGYGFSLGAGANLATGKRHYYVTAQHIQSDMMLLPLMEV